MESEAALGRLVAAYIVSQGPPAIERRDEAANDLAQSLEQVVRERLAGEWEWDDRYASLDGLRTLSIEAAGGRALHIVGAFYLLELRGHRTAHRRLPVEAVLSVEPGAVSTVKLAGADGVFPMPRGERGFARGVESAEWHHSIDLRLA